MDKKEEKMNFKIGQQWGTRNGKFVYQIKNIYSHPYHVIDAECLEDNLVETFSADGKYIENSTSCMDLTFLLQDSTDKIKN